MFFTSEHSQKKHKSKHKKHSKDKDDYKGVTKDNYESKGTINDEPCWMAPLIRVRIISKSFKNGKYYHKKVGIVSSLKSLQYNRNLFIYKFPLAWKAS